MGYLVRRVPALSEPGLLRSELDFISGTERIDCHRGVVIRGQASVRGGLFAVAIVLVWFGLGVGAIVWTIRTVIRAWFGDPPRGLAVRLLTIPLGLAVLGGALGTVLGLVMALGAVGGESVDPSQKARILAEGISEAMNCTAFGFLLWLPCMVALVLLLRRENSSTPDGPDE